MNKRSYTQYCGLAKALDAVGERWTLLIVRNLMLGPLRYSELQQGLPGITTNLLAKRLKEMQAQGFLEKTRLTPGDKSTAYRLTSFGRELEPVLRALSVFGNRWMTGPAPNEALRVEWFLVSLMHRYTGNVSTTAEFVIDEVPYSFTLTPTRAVIRRGVAVEPGMRVRGTSRQVIQLFIAGEIDPALHIEDGSTVLQDLIAAFEFVEPASGE